MNEPTSERTHLAGALQEMKTFKNAALWGDGFMDADPLLPLSWSSYTSAGFISVYHAAYLACIKPYIAKGEPAMEVGPGLGAWTKALIESGASPVFALDVQPRSPTGIDQHLGSLTDRLVYLEVDNFEGEGVPDGEVGFFWSFGTFVHLSGDAQRAYLNTINKKLRPGAHGFIQFADLDIWNSVVTDPALRIDELMARVLGGADGEHLREVVSQRPDIATRETVPERVRNYDVVDPGRYFYVGTEWLANAIRQSGMEVIDENVMPSLRDPVIHFRKP